MSANLEQTLMQKIHALPLPKQEKVLEFVETIEQEEVVDDEISTGENKSDEQARRERLLSLAGIGRSGRSDVSERAEEILEAEINKREGWSFP